MPTTHGLLVRVSKPLDFSDYWSVDENRFWYVFNYFNCFVATFFGASATNTSRMLRYWHGYWPELDQASILANFWTWGWHNGPNMDLLNQIPEFFWSMVGINTWTIFPHDCNSQEPSRYAIVLVWMPATPWSLGYPRDRMEEGMGFQRIHRNDGRCFHTFVI